MWFCVCVVLELVPEGGAGVQGAESVHRAQGRRGRRQGSTIRRASLLH